MFEVKKKEKETLSNLGWRSLLEVMWSNCCSKQIQPDQMAMGLVQSSFKCLQGWRFHILSKQHLIFDLDHGEKIPFIWIFPYCIWTHSLLPLSLCTSKKSLDPSSLKASFRYLHGPVWASMTVWHLKESWWNRTK